MSRDYPILEHQRNAFQAELLGRLATASVDYPTVRCWSSKKLRILLGGLRSTLLKQGVLTTAFPRALDIIAWLSDTGLAYALPVEAGQTSKAETKFYVVEVGAGPQSIVSPFELLQAFQPQGVISFFSALSFHSLTTQTPSFHHSVSLTPRSPSSSRDRRVLQIDGTSSGSKDVNLRDSLGSHAFSYAGMRYYSTKRYRDLVPGVQTQIIDARIRLRVTDLEQALLDTLMHPEACGGQAVIFEVWDQGFERANPSRLADYLRSIKLPVLSRRLGALLNLLGLASSAPLKAALDDARLWLAKEPVSHVPLFRGQNGDRLDPEWQVLTPS